MKGTPGVGSNWTWTTLCADMILPFSSRLGARDAANAFIFIRVVSERLGRRIQMTTDGNRCYLELVEYDFGADIDFTQ